VNLTTTQKLLILLAAWWLLSGKLPSVVAPSSVTAVTYTFEKSDAGIPPPVAAALDKLNRQGIVATHDEIDTTDGTEQVPDQYKVSRPAAKAVGLPALVVMAKDKVVRTVKAPTTEEQVLEAAK
jgi:hypothetical protein